MTNHIKHIAFIMDGNQRWAKKNNQSLKNGYLAGFENINKILDCCISNNIKNITIFAASVENIKRNSANLLFVIIRNYFKKFMLDINNKSIKINFIGERVNIPKDILDIFDIIHKKSSGNVNLNVVFNYGTQFEIKNIIEKLINKNENINIKNIRSNMYIGDTDDPDILVRTGGYSRLSNFILLNLSYTELFFTKTLWPDFSSNELNTIINNFTKLERNYGL